MDTNKLTRILCIIYIIFLDYFIYYLLILGNIMYYGLYYVARLKICAYCNKTIWYWQKGQYTFFHCECREKAISETGVNK